MVNAVENEREGTKIAKESNLMVDAHPARTVKKSCSILDLKHGTRTVGSKFKRAWKASTEMLRKPTNDRPCTMQLCHHCYPGGRDRTWLSLNEICSPSFDDPILPSTIEDIPIEDLRRLKANKTTVERDNSGDVDEPGVTSQVFTGENHSAVETALTTRNPAYDHCEDESHGHDENYNPQDRTDWSATPWEWDDVPDHDHTALVVWNGERENRENRAMGSIDEVLDMHGYDVENRNHGTIPEIRIFPPDDQPRDDQVAGPASEPQTSDEEEARTDDPEEAALDVAQNLLLEKFDNEESEYFQLTDLGHFFFEDVDDGTRSSSSDTETETDEDDSANESVGNGAGVFNDSFVDSAESRNELEPDGIKDDEELNDRDNDTATTVVGVNDETHLDCFVGDDGEKSHDGNNEDRAAELGADKDETTSDGETDLFHAASDFLAVSNRDAEPGRETIPVPDAECNAEPDTEPEAVPVARASTEPTFTPEAEPEAEPVARANTEPTITPNAEADAKRIGESDDKPEAKPKDKPTAELKGKQNAKIEVKTRPQPEPQPEPFIIPRVIVTDYDAEIAYAQAVAAAKKAEIDQLAAFVRARNNRQYLQPGTRYASPYASHPYASAAGSGYAYASTPYVHSSSYFSGPPFQYAQPSYSYSSSSFVQPRFYANTPPYFAHNQASFASSSSRLAPGPAFASNSNYASSSPSRIPRMDGTKLHANKEGKAAENGNGNANRAFGANATNSAKPSRYRPFPGRAGETSAASSSRGLPAYTRWGGRASPSPSEGGSVRHGNDEFELFPKAKKTESEARSEANSKGKGKGKENEGW